MARIPLAAVGVPGEDPDAAAVDVVELGASDLEPVLAEQPLDHGQRVVLEVLVADRVEARLGEHRRHVRELAHPDAVVVEAACDVLDECPGCSRS